MRGKVYLGRYEVQKLLGEGGMGKVYLARQLDLNRSVVLKVMHEHVAADPKFQERFQREMLLMARFQHPYAVMLHDATFNDADGPCIVMEYVRGESLDVLLKRNHFLSPFRVGRILGQLCEVLQEAHNQGIIHRDLKPSNLMVLDADTPFEKIKVMDFGLAKLVEGRSLKAMADSGSGECIIGTPAYMCPEQTRNEELDHRSDLYSVGVMLYELLTGRLPFDGLSTMDTLLAHAVDQPPGMQNRDTWVPPAIEAVVLKCLAKKPEDRFASARDLYLAYEEALRKGDMEETVDEVNAEEELELVPPPVPEKSDPSLAVYQLQAWMPEAIAAHKLRGFMQDVGAEVIESVPGKIRVLLGGRNCTYQLPRQRLGFFGIGSKSGLEMELRICQVSRGRENTLWITVLLKSVGKGLDKSWRLQADQVYRDLRAYLMGTTSVA